MSSTIASCNRCVKDIKYYNVELADLKSKFNELQRNTLDQDIRIKLKHQKNLIEETNNALSDIKKKLKDGLDNIEQDETLNAVEKKQAIFDLKSWADN
eukprot:GAHX01000361.1.p1 GENE.GAHX01000361.1~~GAHX01000361.1.p1  ORF type:complete len:98 (+),score=23.98 GAHX01000361.1:40-333(+)